MTFKAPTEFHVEKDYKDIIKGLNSYLIIMELIQSDIPVTENLDFQKAFRSFYIPSSKDEAFISNFFAIMEQFRKGGIPTYRETLEKIYEETGEVHYSFSSKLLHTLNPESPILDSIVMNWLGYSIQNKKTIYKGKKTAKQIEEKEKQDAKNRIDYYCAVYDDVCSEYKKHLQNTPKIRLALSRFNEVYPQFKNISDVKKLDTLLWRLKDEKRPSILDYFALT